MAERWRIELFGGLRVQQGGQALPRLETRKAGALLAYLALHPDRSHPRETLAELLWPEEDPRATLPRLRQTLSLVRRALEPADTDEGRVLIADRAAVRLNAAAITTDVAEFEAVLQAAERTSDVGEQIRLLTRAEELSRGEFLAVYEEAWITAEQARLGELRIEALTGLAGALAEAGDPAAGIDFAREAVRADPVREETHRSLMRLYAAAGRTSEALRQYRELERVLRDELGAAPDAPTRELFAQLQAATHASTPRGQGPGVQEEAQILNRQGGSEPPFSPSEPAPAKPPRVRGTMRQLPVAPRALAVLATLLVIGLGYVLGPWSKPAPRARRTATAPSARQAPGSRPGQDAATPYEQGRDAWRERSEAGFGRAIPLLQQAILVDPNHARAYSGLADTYSLLAYYGYLSPQEAKSKAKGFVEQARRIDPDSVEARTSLAWILMAFDWDWAAAEREFRAAIATDNEYATAHQWYSLFLMTRLRTQASLREIEAARKLDPLNRVIAKSLGQRYYYARKYDQAVPVFKEVLLAEPTSSLTRYWLALTYEQQALRAREAGQTGIAKARFRAAEQEFRKALKHTADASDPSILAGLAHLLGATGKRADAKRNLGRLMKLKERRYVSPVALAEVHIGLGDHGQALTWLERAWQDGSPELILLKIEPRFDPLRGEERFIRLVRRLWPE